MESELVVRTNELIELIGENQEITLKQIRWAATCIQNVYSSMADRHRTQNLKFYGKRLASLTVDLELERKRFTKPSLSNYMTFVINNSIIEKMEKLVEDVSQELI